MRASCRAEQGETLLETLIAIVMVGLAVTAVLGGVAASSVLSDDHRRLTMADIALKQATESLKAQDYSWCGVLSPTCSGGYALPALSTGASATVTVLCLPDVHGTTTDTASAVACTTSTDSGVQLVTVTLKGGIAETTQIIKRAS